MSINTSKISVNYNEIANLAKQLNNKDKLKLVDNLKNSLKGRVAPGREETEGQKELIKSFLKLRGTGNGNLNKSLLKDRLRDKINE